MDLLIEFILELILEGSIEIVKVEKIPKFIRYPILCLIILLFTTIILGLIILGILSIKKELFLGLFLIALGFVFLLGIIHKTKKQYKEYKKGEATNEE